MATDKEQAEMKQRMTEAGIIQHGFNCGATDRGVCDECTQLVIAFWKVYDKENRR